MSATSFPIMLSAEDTDASVDSENGVSAGAVEQAHINHESSDGQYPVARVYSMEGAPLDTSSGSDGASDESDDGGVPLGMTSSHAAALNAEMDLLDAEVMGPYNLAAIATTSVYNSALDDMDHDHWHAQLGAEEDMNPANHPDWLSDTMMDDGSGHANPGLTMADNPVAMSEVSTQLQIIQDGQAHGSPPNFSAQHGAAPANSISPRISIFVFTIQTSILSQSLHPMTLGSLYLYSAMIHCRTLCFFRFIPPS